MFHKTSNEPKGLNSTVSANLHGNEGDENKGQLADSHRRARAKREAYGAEILDVLRKHESNQIAAEQEKSNKESGKTSQARQNIRDRFLKFKRERNNDSGANEYGSNEPTQSYQREEEAMPAQVFENAASHQAFDKAASHQAFDNAASHQVFNNTAPHNDYPQRETKTSQHSNGAERYENAPSPRHNESFEQNEPIDSTQLTERDRDIHAQSDQASIRQEDKRQRNVKRQNTTAQGQNRKAFQSRQYVSSVHSSQYQNDTRNSEFRPFIDPMSVIRGILNAKKIIVMMTILGLALGVFVALSTSKKYISTAEVLIDPRDIRVTENNFTNEGLPSDATLALIENKVRLMYSNKVLAKVVEDLSLDLDPEFNGTGGGFGLGAVISGLRSLFSTSPNVMEGRSREFLLAQQNLSKALTIQRGGKTFVVSVSAKTNDPVRSAEVANTVVTVFQEVTGNLESNKVGRTETELRGTLEKLAREVATAENAVEAYKRQNGLINAQGRLISDEEILRLSEQLSTARAQTMEFEARAKSLKTLNTGNFSSFAVPGNANSDVLAQLRAQYSSLRQEADSLAIKLGPRHPQRQAVEAQLSAAKNQIKDEIGRIVSSAQSELKRAKQYEQELSSSLARAEIKQSEISGDLVKLRELERELAAKRTVYEAYLVRAGETGQQKEISTANISVISEAEPPLQSAGLSRSMMVLLGGVLGFLVGVMIGALSGAYQSFVNRSNEDEADRQSRIQHQQQYENTNYHQDSADHNDDADEVQVTEILNDTDSNQQRENTMSQRAYAAAPVHLHTVVDNGANRQWSNQMGHDERYAPAQPAPQQYQNLPAAHYDPYGMAQPSYPGAPQAPLHNGQMHRDPYYSAPQQPAPMHAQPYGQNYQVPPPVDRRPMPPQYQEAPHSGHYDHAAYQNQPPVLAPVPAHAGHGDPYGHAPQRAPVAPYQNEQRNAYYPAATPEHTTHDQRIYQEELIAQQQQQQQRQRQVEMERENADRREIAQLRSSLREMRSRIDQLTHPDPNYR